MQVWSKNKNKREHTKIYWGSITTCDLRPLKTSLRSSFPICNHQLQCGDKFTNSSVHFYMRTYHWILLRDFVQDSLNLPSIFVQDTLKLIKVQVDEDFTRWKKNSLNRVDMNGITQSMPTIEDKEFSRNLNFLSSLDDQSMFKDVTCCC